MGKSKPSMAPPTAEEIALGEIGMEMFNDYTSNYRPKNEELLKMAATDRSGQAAGRSAVDAQIAVDDAYEAQISRAQSSGGLGSGAAISLVDAGTVGGTVGRAANTGKNAGTLQGQSNLNSALNTVQTGQDTSIGGMRSAGGIAAADALGEYNQDQAMNSIRNQGITNTISNVGSAYMTQTGINNQKASLEAMRKSTEAASKAATGLGNFQRNFFDLYAPPTQRRA